MTVVSLVQMKRSIVNENSLFHPSTWIKINKKQLLCLSRTSLKGRYKSGEIMSLFPPARDTLPLFFWSYHVHIDHLMLQVNGPGDIWQKRHIQDVDLMQDFWHPSSNAPVFDLMHKYNVLDRHWIPIKNKLLNISRISVSYRLRARST